MSEEKIKITKEEFDSMYEVIDDVPQAEVEKTKEQIEREEFEKFTEDYDSEEFLADSDDDDIITEEYEF